jgi:6-phosphogluconolactonase
VGTNFASEIRVAANGRYVYAANRLHDSIGVFTILANGRLRQVGQAATHGDYPRSFGIEPFNSFLYACDQRSDSIGIFNLEAGGGSVVFTNQYVAVGSPACIVFLNLT